MKPPQRVILLVPSGRELDRGLRRGVFEYARQHGPWVFLEEAPAYLQGLSPRQRLQHLRAWHPNGIIVLRSRSAEVRPLRLPMVAIGMDGLGASRYGVVCANEEIGRMGARALIGLGLRHFAYCGFETLDFSDRRGAAFKQAVEEAGYPAMVYSNASQGRGTSWYEQERLARWLSSLPKPLGLMACNDDRARMVAEICLTHDIRVPDDIAILGVDNDEQVCRSCHPPLSSISLATEQSGYEAAALLASMMARQKPANQVITVSPTHVVPRQSTDILAVDDVQVGRAVRFIRENSNRKLRVADLVPVAGLSRRALQDAFVRSLGRPPMEEIHSARVERISQLLVETNMSIGKIAEATGFEIDAHLARFFSRRAGMTPLAYRSKHRIS